MKLLAAALMQLGSDGSDSDDHDWSHPGTAEQDLFSVPSYPQTAMKVIDAQDHDENPRAIKRQLTISLSGKHMLLVGLEVLTATPDVMQHQ